MPISSKKIIRTIDELPSSFTRNDLQKKLLTPVKEETGPRVKKRKKSSKGSQSKDLSKIESTLNLLIDAGFIVKEKQRFRKANPLTIDGTIKINSSGDALVKYNDEDIIIRREDTGNAQNNDSVTIEICDCRKGFLSGRVSNVIKRKKEVNLGRVTAKTGGLIILRLLDVQGETDICVQKSGKSPAIGDFALITLTGKMISGRTEGKIIQYFSEDEERHDFTRIKLRHSLPDDHDYFNEEEQDLTVPEEELRNRKDYRKLFTITIDGDSSKDFDDAISIRESGNSTKLYVHIADVSAYVGKGSRLDEEAFARGTSYYLGDRVIPMLPEKLSNDLCSLKEGVDRLTLTAEMSFDSKGNMTKFEAFRGIIKVNKRMTYNNTEKIIKGRSLTQLNRTIQKMNKLAKLLNKKRISDGKLDLNLTDQEVIYENGMVKEIRFAPRLQSQSLIEEFMLSANEAVSRALKENGIPALYRVHEKISEDNIFSLKKFLTVLNVKLDTGKTMGKSIQDVLAKVSGKPYEQVVNLVVLKSMMQAYYGPEPLGHFGLGFLDYTHFTSPIRRYPDLIVHRCLKSLIDSSSSPYRMPELIEIGEKSSMMERIAQKAERDLIKIKSCRLMKQHIGEEFDVIISGLTKFGMFVSLIDMPIEGMVPLKNLTDDYYVLKEDEFTVIGRKLNKRYRLGDRIKVRLVNADLEMLRIDFDLVQVKRRR
ncbi:MAG TPA: ribonuclease R [Spirochaetota bacterium]|nr:ribonuclease R [Spirochaetota bacterium]HRX48479.1 ribonuclease R [Spirochaetota bacterium]